MSATASMPVLGWILLLPFAGALILGLLHLTFPRTKKLDNLYAAIGVAGPVFAALLSFLVLDRLLETDHAPLCRHTLFQWIAIGDFKIGVTLAADMLSGIMLFIVTFVGSLIHIYAVGYMWGEKSFGKFFAYFNFFLGSMLLLVLADNPIIMFVGWELVGLASYLLIGWYYDDPANVKAANKAFILNRVGDFGFISGLGLLFALVGSGGFDFSDIAAHIGSVDPKMVWLVGMLLFVGAMGKSAQIPLYVWLPDAMAGPTPVSALIHAATMVTAGVYMVARFAFLYNLVPDVGVFIASIGAASALLAALFACYQSDIKKILAYSTMSQLGYMFIGVGLGAYSSGIFHLFTHAFFKALLFMGAGAVIIALHHEQNIFKMGGLQKKMGLVTLTMLVATLAISGIPPFAGFFSKDAILAHAFASQHYMIWAIGVATAYLTAYYMFRLFFVVFVAPSGKNQEPDRLPKTVTWPLVVLAAGSAIAGLFGVPEAYGGENWLGTLMHLPDRNLHLGTGEEFLLDMFNVIVASAGIYVAYRLFARSPKEANGSAAWQTLLRHTLYIDTLYETLFVKPLRGLSFLFDKIVDNRIIDGIIGMTVGGYRFMAGGFALLQNGSVRWYALYIMAGVGGLSLYILQSMGG
ncbi:NADH-quinone oxidoreductase subunit L [Hydrogenimonas sp.]|uniref:NADH-quinone oxidoreductase subunit L n=1 Tax=Hydrogenimonas sp. TaxID=2231112 RepID=UPI002607F0BE|nr:NADH-quinone oxidoreductase subunit L [Hydrogenimonas sp.]